MSEFDDVRERLIPLLSHPLKVDHALGVGAVVLSVMAIGLGAAAGANSLPLLAAVGVPGFAALFIGATILGESLAYAQALDEALMEAREKRRFTSPGAVEAAARKHYLQIVRSGPETLAEFDRRRAHARWNRYLLANFDHGGAEVLAYYREPIALLRAAEAVEWEISWAENRRRKLVEELSETRIRNLTEAQLELEQERLRAQLNGQQPPLPWEAKP
jgi:hypothetical protein